MTCEPTADIVEQRIDRVADQYRESVRLIGLLRNLLQQPAEQAGVACEMLDYFDLDTAIGDQLTIAGKMLGWPRTHCRGQRRPVFGFVCEDDDCPPSFPIVGFCEDGEWQCSGSPEYIEFTFADDDVYRKFLKARRWSIAGEYSRAGIVSAAHDAFGPLATILNDGAGVIRIAPGRALTGVEIAIAHLYEQVLPIPPGVRLEIWHSRGKVFGFGEGWGGFCDGYWPTKVTVN